MLRLLKLSDIAKFHTGVFMFSYGAGLLPDDFDSFFTEIRDVHSYCTRLATKLKSLSYMLYLYLAQIMEYLI